MSSVDVSQFVVLTGNPVDGVDIYGPFDDFDDADQFAAHANFAEEWWIVRLKTKVAEGTPRGRKQATEEEK